MIKAKEVSLMNMVLFLIASMAISAAYFVSRPHGVSNQSLPVFMGDEVVVQRAPFAKASEVKADTAMMAIKAGTAARAKTVERAVTMAQPPIQTVLPLPIIPPSVSIKVLPAYPLAALEKGIEGTALLSVYVGLNGQPDKIETKNSSGMADLDESARAALSQWKFTPATQGGSALASWLEIPVKFEIN
jgi:protein TonB